MGGGGALQDEEAITGINVTPLVDITLVLLIIFMVTTKIVLNQTVPLDLPKAATGTSDVQVVFSIVLALDGRVLVDGKQIVNDDAILPMAREAQTEHPDLRAVIKADTAVTHGRVIHVLDLLKQAHVSKIAFGVSPSQLAGAAASPSSSPTGAAPGAAAPAPAPAAPPRPVAPAVPSPPTQ